MAPNMFSLTEATDLSGATNVTASDWFIVTDNVTGGRFDSGGNIDCGRKDDVFPKMLKKRQKFGKPQEVIGIPLPSQKLPYLNYRRNSARI